MMRVALVHSYYSSAAPSGENVAVQLQAEALVKAGVDVNVVSASTDSLSQQRFYRARTAAGVAVGGGADPTGYLRAWRPDVIHVHNLFPNFATRWLNRWRGPVVATLHNYRPLCAAGTLVRDGSNCFECVGKAVALPALKHRCYRGSAVATLPLVAANAGGVNHHPLLARADALVFLAHRAQTIYRDAGFARMEVARVIPNFVAPSPVPVPDARARSQAPWLYVGRLAPEKGIVPLLRHWPQTWPLHVYGGGPQEAEVTQLCRGAIEFRGSAERAELLRAMPAYRGLIFPSLFAEGLPTVYLESLAAGLPVVAMTGNSAADDVELHSTGLTFGDFHGLITAVETVQGDHVRFAENALAGHAQRFSPAAWTEEILAVYRDLTTRKAA